MSDDTERRRYHPVVAWILGIAVGVAVVMLPLVALDTLAEDGPAIQVISVESSTIGVIEGNGQRILFASTWSPAEARSFYGRVTSPWDPHASTLVAPGSDLAAPGVLELLERAQPGKLIVLGVPGADPEWAHVERWCRDHDVEINWVVDTVSFHAGDLLVTALVGRMDGTGPSDLLIRGPGGSLVVELGWGSSGIDGDIIIASQEDSVRDARLIVGGTAPTITGTPRLAIDPGDLVNISMASDALRVSGGRLVQSP